MDTQTVSINLELEEGTDMVDADKIMRVMLKALGTEEMMKVKTAKVSKVFATVEMGADVFEKANQG